jgi:hypothetical protein
MIPLYINNGRIKKYYIFFSFQIRSLLYQTEPVKLFLESDAPRAQRGASRSLNLIIYKLCRFIPAYKAGLSRHLPVNGFLQSG